MPELIDVEPGLPEWLAARRQGVTATDIVTILGLSSWDSVYSLFWRKMGQVGEAKDSDRFRLGRALEPYIAGRWDEVTGLLERSGGLYRHSERAWQMATLDAMTLGREAGTCEPIELKSWADADMHSWQDGPPARVRAQVLWQMDVMGVATGHVGVVFLPSGEFRSYTIEHDPDMNGCRFGKQDPGAVTVACSACIDQALMRAAGEEFMARLRLELPPPDPDSSAATLAAVRARFARVPAKQAEIDKLTWTEYDIRCDVLRTAEQMKRAAEIRLREQAGEAGEYTVNGELVARRIISDAQVRAHVRHQDYIRRIKQGDDSEC